MAKWIKGKWLSDGAVSSDAIAADAITAAVIEDGSITSAKLAAGVAVSVADLASTLVSKGASLIGVYDVGALFTAENVEAVLQELGASSLATLFTARGDIVRAGIGGVAEVLGLGTAYKTLVSDGTDVVWDFQAPPPIRVAMSAEDIDFVAGAVQTDTVDGAKTYTASNYKVGWVIHLELTNSGAQSEPTWPGTTTTIGTGTFLGDDAAVNHVYLECTNTVGPTFAISISQPV